MNLEQEDLEALRKMYLEMESIKSGLGKELLRHENEKARLLSSIGLHEEELKKFSKEIGCKYNFDVSENLIIDIKNGTITKRDG